MTGKTSAQRSRDIEFAYGSAQPSRENSGDSQASILVIDDDPVMRKLLLEMLGHEYQVFASSHGLELPRLMAEFKPDLIMMDVVMSWVNGLELCRALKARPAWRKVPVLLISGRRKPEDIALGLKAGADEYLTKPFRMQELLDKVKLLLKVDGA